MARFGYRDWPYPESSPLSCTPFVVVPHWNWRGQADYGLFADGGTKKCQPGGTRCVITRWRHRALAQSQDNGALGDGYGRTYVWLGSLIEDKEDATRTVYRRNRYFDPLTGQFTQEDPIGLAGGLNLYGFANGDPVNFSDPFGLCAGWLAVARGLCTRAIALVPGAVAAGRWLSTRGQRLVEGVRGLIQNPAVRQGADLVDEAAERVGAARAGAYDIAAAGGRHAGTLSNYAGRAVSELTSAVRSLEGRVAEHLSKIADPARFVENWSSLDPRAQQGMLRFWEREAASYAQQAEVIRGILARQ